MRPWAPGPGPQRADLPQRQQGPSELIFKSLCTLFVRSYTLFFMKYVFLVNSCICFSKKMSKFWKKKTLSKNMSNLEETCKDQSIYNFNDFLIYPGYYLIHINSYINSYINSPLWRPMGSTAGGEKRTSKAPTRLMTPRGWWIYKPSFSSPKSSFPSPRVKTKKRQVS